MTQRKRRTVARQGFDAHQKTINLLDQARAELASSPDNINAQKRIDIAVETSKMDRPESAVLGRLLRICCLSGNTLCIQAYLDAHNVTDCSNPIWDGSSAHHAQYLDLRSLLSGGHFLALDLLISRGLPWHMFIHDFIDTIVASQSTRQLCWFLTLPHAKLINNDNIARIIRDAGPDLAPLLAERLIREVRGGAPGIATSLRRALLKAQVHNCLKSSTIWIWIAASEAVDIQANPSCSQNTDIINMVENAQSGHGRLRLLKSEPSLEGIVKRCKLSFRLGDH